ncbi:MAG: DUF3106 domain-containing protein [Porticoccaceae bacterium]
MNTQRLNHHRSPPGPRYERRRKVEVIYRNYNPALLCLGFALLLLLITYAPRAAAAYSPASESASYQSNTAYLLAGNDRNNDEGYGQGKSRNGKKNRKERWEQLTPERQERIKQRRERFEKLPPEEKKRVKQARERFRKMPAEERKALREKWETLSPEERRQQRRQQEH